MDEKSNMTRDEKKNLIMKLITRFSLLPVLLGLLTLLPAGTFNYWQVYLYIIILFIPMLFVLFYCYNLWNVIEYYIDPFFVFLILFFFFVLVMLLYMSFFSN